MDIAKIGMIRQDLSGFGHYLEGRHLEHSDIAEHPEEIEVERLQELRSGRVALERREKPESQQEDWITLPN